MYLCTYFDSNYAEKGFACWESIKKQSNYATLFVLCLDNAVYQTIKNINDGCLFPIQLEKIEECFPKLLEAKSNRLPKEYYATLTAFFPRYLFEAYGLDVIFYTDADMAFWSAPEEMLDVMGDKSLMVSDHGFEPPRAGVRFNVGILGYRNDKNCIEFLDWWGERCIEWCKWVTMPDGRMADQGYLNIIHDEPDKFKNTLVCPHPGINLGPWNIAKHQVTNDDGKVKVDGHNLISYHYHEFKRIGEYSYYPTGWKISDTDRKWIYDPYLKLLQGVENDDRK